MPDCQNLRVKLCANVLAGGGVVACPTESVWGLSCDPFSPEAIERVLMLKQRPIEKGLILVAADEVQLEFLLHDLPQHARRKLSVSWPGPNTWLVPHKGRVSALVHGRYDSVAVRVSGHRGMRSLCSGFGGPLVSTSANPAGCAAPRSRIAVRRYFGDHLDAWLPGTVGGVTRPSTIRDVFSDEVFRA